MAEKTEISWCDSTFNPWWSCTQISPGCDNCFAKTLAARFGYGWNGAPMRLFGGAHWAQPLKWAKTLPAKLGRRPRVFSMSMGDWLDLDAPIDQFVRLLRTIEATPELDWLLLTKRIGNWHKRLRAAVEHVDQCMSFVPRWAEDWLNGKPPANVWLGATVVNQEEADRDIPKLLAVPARVRFLSIEPMLSAINLISMVVDEQGRRLIGAQPGIDWAIGGFESGPHARPGNPAWARKLRDQCAAAGVAFHWKQNGEFASVSEVAGPGRHHQFESGETVRRVGKAAAGRLLDGVTHDGFPEAK